MPSVTYIKVKTESGLEIPLTRRNWLVPTQDRGSPPPAQRSKSIQYELASGEAVKEVAHNQWEHPITGEKLIAVSA